MQNLIRIIFTGIIILCVNISVRAQEVKILPAAGNVTLKYKVLSDTGRPPLDPNTLQLKYYKLQLDTLQKMYDRFTMFKADTMLAKSMLRQKYALDSLQSSLYRKQDSLFKTLKPYFKQQGVWINDSIGTQVKRKTMVRLDSMNRQVRHLYMTADSFQNMRLYDRKKGLDSLHRLVYNRQLKADSSIRFVKGYQLSLSDSFLRFKTMRDSSFMRFKTLQLNLQLEQMKKNLQQKKADSLQLKKRKLQPEITAELPAAKDINLTIEEVPFIIIVRTWNEKKVKLQLDPVANSSASLAAADYFKSRGILFSGDEKKLFIRKTLAEGSQTAINVQYASGLKIKEAGDMVAVNPTESLIIFIPAAAGLNIISRGEDVLIENDIAMLGVDISNADLVMQNADRATIKCDFGSVTAGFIDHADIKITDTKFICRETGSFNIDSKHSTVTFTKSGVIAFKSVSDQYDIRQVKEIRGEKQFGEIRVADVKNSFVLTGSSADVSISNIDQSASLVKIDNKYASVRLPVRNTPNFSLYYVGHGNRIKTFSTDQVNDSQYESKLFRSTNGYTVSAGNLAGNYTSFQINCNNCALDLK